MPDSLWKYEVPIDFWSKETYLVYNHLSWQINIQDPVGEDEIYLVGGIES